jgi:hypothetical protein
MIDIKGLDRAKVLLALYNAARPAALHGGYPRGPMDPDDAHDLVADTSSFTWVNGRALYVDISGEKLDAGLYDHHNGRLCAATALAPLIAAQTPAREQSDRDFVAGVLAHSPLAAGPKG